MTMIDRNIKLFEGSKKILIFLFSTGVIDALLIAGQALGLAFTLTNIWLMAGTPDVNEGALSPLNVVGSQTVWIALFFCCYLARQGVAYIRSSVMDNYSATCASTLRKNLTKKLVELGPSAVQKYGSGNVTTMISEGVSQVENYIGLLLPKVADMMVIPVVLTVFLFCIDLISGIIALVMIPVIVVYMRVLGGNAKDTAALQHKEFQRMGNHFMDTIRGLSTLKVFGASKDYESTIFSVSEDFRKATMKTLQAAFLSSLALDIIRTFALAAVAIMLGFRLMNGQIELLPALACLITVPEYFGAIKRFAGDFHATLEGKNQLQSITDFLNEEAPQKNDACEVKPWNDASTLEVSSLSYQYPSKSEEDAPFCLKDISFALQGNKKVGLIGISGSGKTTLANVLSGFTEPTTSQIAINGAEAHFTSPSWLKQVTYIPQKPHIFHDTLANNIAFYCPQASEAQIVEAAKIAGLSEVIDSLPEGLETIIGEGGRSLSGGQAQRIALARAFLDTSRSVLVFDEPTAHLDIETELELKECMLPLMENKLVFFATHRLHWAPQMDVILVLNEGEIVQSGTFQQLLQEEGPFKELAQQMRGDFSYE